MNKPKDFNVDMEDMLDGIKLILNTRKISGEYSLVEIIEDMGFKHIEIICDEKLYQYYEHVRNMIDRLEEQHEVFLKLYDYSFEPSYQYLDVLIGEIRGINLEITLDKWIGIGGGSSIDTAKGLAILCKNEGPAIQYKGFPKELNKQLPVITIS